MSSSLPDRDKVLTTKCGESDSFSN
jgi:hypothetical protein